MGSMYQALIFIGIMNCTGVLPMVAQERAVLNRERSSGMYSCYAYSLAQVAIEIPCQLFLAAVYVVITYPTIGYYLSVTKIMFYYYIVWCTLLGFSYLGMLIMSLSSNVQIASIMASASYTIFNLFSGFWMPKPHIPVWWTWLYWICPLPWALRGLMTSQYGEVTNTITTSDGEIKTVAAFLSDYYGFQANQVKVTLCVIAIFPVIFASIFSYNIGRVNFQKR